MNLINLTAFSIFLLGAYLVCAHARCIWYGIGEYSETHPRYKYYNGTGKRLPDDESFNTLSKICPTYAENRDSLVCCDPEQLSFYYKSSQGAYPILRRCPACWANFRALFCGLTCAPNQDEFMIPTVIEGLVESVDFNLTEHAASTLYNSCKDVTFGSGRALDTLCSSSSCTQAEFFKQLGEGPMGPFPVRFAITNETGADQKPFDGVEYTCNQSVPRQKLDEGGPACSCTDCELSCPVPPVPPPPVKPVTIFGINIWYACSFIVFMVLALALVSYEIVVLVYRRPYLPDEDAVGGSKEPEPTAAAAGNWVVRLRASFENCMSSCFFFTGRTVARHPYITVVIAVVCSVALCCGVVFFQVTTNPVELWSSPNSRYRLEKDYFDQNFAPFYRTEQLIIRPVNQSCFIHENLNMMSGTSCFGPALEKGFLSEVYALQNEIENLFAYSGALEQNVTLSDICFKPLAPDNMKCAITSPIEYFQNNFTFFNYTLYGDCDEFQADYLNHLLFCAGSPTSVAGSPLNDTASCLGSSGMPILPIVALGGFNGSNYNESTAVVLTFLVNNNADPKSKQVQMAEAWESVYLDHIQQWANSHKNVAVVAYQAERSVEDEINRQSNADISTVLISYIVMFVYVSIFLASYRSCRTVFVDLRITLGLSGVLIVIVSVVSAVGIFSYAGVPATLIIIEVIPFLVLAVGVDNIFILVHEYEFDDEEATNVLHEVKEQALASAHSLRSSGLSDDGHHDDVQLLLAAPEMSGAVKRLVEVRVARSLSRVGPSLLLTSLTEAVAFFCGALTTMPAVKMFALYAGVALLFNFILQLTIFIALLTLDERRRAMQRFDVLCCFGLKSSDNISSSHIHHLPESVPPTGEGVSSATKPEGEDTDWHSLSLNSNALSDVQPSGHAKNDNRHMPWLHRLIANWWTPFLLCGWVRPLVLLLSAAWLCTAVAVIPNFLTIGLDQRLAMPTDSYMQAYFDGLANDLRVGPPVYFVVTHGHDYVGSEGQNEVCSSAGCPQDSLLGHIGIASRLPNYTRIATPAMSWIDDYFDWLASGSPSLCCRVYNSDPTKFCPDSELSDVCHACPVRLNNTRPSAEDFMHYLPFFLSQNPSIKCPKGGKAAYGTAVKIHSENKVTNIMTDNSVRKTPSSAFSPILSLSDKMKTRLANILIGLNPLTLEYNAPTPGDSTPIPGHSTPTPGHSTRTPGHSTPTPGHSTPTPGHSTRTPGHSTPTPGHSTPTPGHSTPTPGHSTPTPGHSTPTPGHSTPTPGHSTRTPGHSTPTPRYSTRTPEHSTPTPGHSTPTPGHKATAAMSISGKDTNDIHVNSKLPGQLNMARVKAASSASKRPTADIGPTYFMAYHAVLKTPDDYINSLKSTRQLTDLVNAEWKAKGHQPIINGIVPDGNIVYAYSVFYVYNEQYLNILTEAATHLGICLAAVTVVTFLLLGLNLMATLVIVFGVVYILVSLVALMALWGISLNAISLVNLVVAVGIAVEFCSHIVRAFTVNSAPTRLERAKAALADMGSSILRGITLTKLGGIVVLAFSQSQLFSIFYFRMYLGIIAFGAATGLFVLPVFLSYFGPGLNKAASEQHSKRVHNRYRQIA